MSKSVMKGVTAGVVGGLAASWVMNQFQSVVGRAFEGPDKPHGAQSKQTGSPEHGVAAELQKLGLDDPDDNAAERIASIVAAKVFNHRLSEDGKRLVGAVSHYAFGATTGAMYGAVSELAPRTAIGAGLPFGAAVWLVADEIVVPSLGLSKPMTQYPLSKHAYALASHLVFGATTDLMYRITRKALPPGKKPWLRP